MGDKKVESLIFRECGREFYIGSGNVEIEMCNDCITECGRTFSIPPELVWLHDILWDLMIERVVSIREKNNFLASLEN